jgi:hypothetical protein
MPRAWKHNRETRKVARIDSAEAVRAEATAELLPFSERRTGITGIRGRVVEAPDTSPQLPLAQDYMSRVPVVAVPADWITMTRIDHRAGYLLSRIDGAMNVETVLDISCMSTEETLELLEELIGLGLVTLR